MKLKIREIVDTSAALKVLANTKINFPVAIKVGKIVKLFDPIIADYENKRLALLVKYGEEFNDPQSPGNKSFKFLTEEAGMAFQTAFIELIETDVEVCFDVLTYDDVDDIQIEPIYLTQLLDVVLFEK